MDEFCQHSKTLVPPVPKLVYSSWDKISAITHCGLMDLVKAGSAGCPWQGECRNYPRVKKLNLPFFLELHPQPGHNIFCPSDVWGFGMKPRYMQVSCQTAESATKLGVTRHTRKDVCFSLGWYRWTVLPAVPARADAAEHIGLRLLSNWIVIPQQSQILGLS